MLQQFESAEETNHRLAGSIILYRKEPVYVQQANNNAGVITLILASLPLPKSELQAVKLSDPELSAVFSGLGYINHTLWPVAVWASRIPNRGRYRQGIYDQNLSVERPASLPGMVRTDYQNLLRVKGFTDMFRGEYPTPGEVLDRFQKSAPMKIVPNEYGEVQKVEGIHSVAFDRSLAFERDSFRDDILLIYKGAPIGYGNKFFNIKPEFKYLRETLDEKGVKLA